SGMAAVAWRLGGIPLTPMAVLGTNIGLAAVGLIGAYLSVKLYMPETSESAYHDVETPAEGKGVSLMH
ncbi:hypothetical protein As57867_020654, partial [Aphanomyces stellatus]